jgi:hypothetical protein
MLLGAIKREKIEDNDKRTDHIGLLIMKNRANDDTKKKAQDSFIRYQMIEKKLLSSHVLII